MKRLDPDPTKIPGSGRIRNPGKTAGFTINELMLTLEKKLNPDLTFFKTRNRI